MAELVHDVDLILHILLVGPEEKWVSRENRSGREATYISQDVYTWACAHSCAHKHIHTLTGTHSHTYVYTFTHTLTYKHIYVCITHSYTHTHLMLLSTSAFTPGLLDSSPKITKKTYSLISDRTAKKEKPCCPRSCKRVGRATPGRSHK